MIKFKKGDILIFCLIILAAVIIWFPKSQKGSIAILEVDGERIRTFNLNVNTVYRYTAKFTNVITIKDGAAYVSEADCPDSTCVKTGKISKNGEIICCLPNKLTLRIISDDPKTDVIAG